MDNQPKAKARRWIALGQELALRAVEPLEHPTFVIFFLAIVVGVGGVGTWVELFKLSRAHASPDPLDGLITSLVTFCFALVGTSCTQLIIEESESKALRALAQCVLFVAFVGGVLATAGVAAGKDGILPWAIASVAALAVWWIANAKSPGLRDPEAPTGGSVDKDLPGDLAGYKTD